MSLEGEHSYRFGVFSFSPAENVLRRGDEIVPLTPRMFELLRVLIENHGRILKKDDLMKTVWADGFVEEGNLAVTIRQLRKALGDDAHRPTYIETVSRRAYHFIAEVEEIFPAEEESKNNSSAQKPAVRPKSRIFFPLIITASILLVSVMVAGSWYFRNKTLEPSAPILSQPFALEMLSTNGKVLYPTLSPDGKNVFYINVSGERQSVWLRQLESGNNVEIIPPSDDVYFGLTISPDGNFLYFVRRPKGGEAPAALYRVSIFGGLPTKITDETQGWMSVSPDGAKISFVRCFHQDDEYCSLWVADADGKNERKIASRPRPFRIGDNKISPDGKSVAFCAGQSDNEANDFGLQEVDIESGAERELTAEKFFNVKSLVWLPDESGLLITARKHTERNFRIWHVSLPSGAAERLTNDSEIYVDLSLDKAAGRLVTTQFKRDVRLNLFRSENPSQAHFLADAVRAAFASNGKIFIAAEMTGNSEIWSINPDGGERRQLTNDPASDSEPAVSPDSNSIFFASNRTGAVQVWRMNPDGSNQTQITQKEGGFPMLVSPDGRWVYYRHGFTRTLWRVSAQGGGEQSVLNKEKFFWGLSPDASRVAFSETQGDRRILTIVSLPDGQTIRTFPLSEGKSDILHIAWQPDGKSVAYILFDIETRNKTLWLQPLDGAKPQLITGLGNAEVLTLTFTPDGKSFAVGQGNWRHDAVLLKGLK